tara:strand:+ start:308 stop:460 length:153 start_codon:yes stop_codon:yes gene_type:complete
MGKNTSIKNKTLDLTYLKVKKVPTIITPQQVAIAEKIPVFKKIDLLVIIL